MIRSVRVVTYPAAIDVTDRPRPGTPHEARFSLQYAVATTLATGRPGMAAFEPPALADERVQGLLERINVGVDPALAASYPRRWGAAVEIERTDGSCLVERITSASGDPERPLSDPQLDAKLLDLLAWAGLRTRRARALLRRCRRLPAGGALFALPRIELGPTG